MLAFTSTFTSASRAAASVTKWASPPSNADPQSCGAGYKYYGLNRGEHEGKEGIWYREWAPGARVQKPDPSPPP